MSRPRARERHLQPQIDVVAVGQQEQQQQTDGEAAKNAAPSRGRRARTSTR